MQQMNRVLVVVGRGVGGVVGALYQAGRDSLDQILRNIIPFMAFIALVIGIILESGIGDIIANALTPLAGNLFGLIIISIVCALPILSPLLGPGAVIAQVVGTLLGSTLIAQGTIHPRLALPALFAINPQVGCDFIPVGLALGEAEPETVEVGVPAILFSRLITGPIAVVIAYFASFGLYTDA
ncbi:MAG: PTS glucitol/sorbitol transporter subunit IIB [Okeania sp. SIO3B3]|nr:PTS glucitol/sorbitol transporter subunit IIB [Okeania sp. SIO3B3]